MGQKDTKPAKRQTPAGFGVDLVELFELYARTGLAPAPIRCATEPPQDIEQLRRADL